MMASAYATEASAFSASQPTSGFETVPQQICAGGLGAGLVCAYVAFAFAAFSAEVHGSAFAAILLLTQASCAPPTKTPGCANAPECKPPPVQLVAPPPEPELLPDPDELE